MKSNTMKNSEIVIGIEDQGDYHCFKLRVNNLLHHFVFIPPSDEL